MQIRSAKELGALINERRKALGYTQAQLAQRCGCGIRFLSELENGKPSIQMDKALKIATRLGLEVSASSRK